MAYVSNFLDQVLAILAADLEQSQEAFAFFGGGRGADGKKAGIFGTDLSGAGAAAAAVRMGTLATGANGLTNLSPVDQEAVDEFQMKVSFVCHDLSQFQFPAYQSNLASPKPNLPNIHSTSPSRNSNDSGTT